jgi:hypothetical protein
MALRTLIVSTVIVIIYSAILYAEKSIYDGYWRKMFFSYVTATSLYDIIVKYAVIGFGMLWNRIVGKLNKTS